MDCIFSNNITEFILISMGYIIMSHICYFHKEFDFRKMEFLEKRDSKRRTLSYNLNGRDTSTNSSKHGYSSKYVKIDSSITDVFNHEENRRDTITGWRTFRIKYPNNVITDHLNINSVRSKFELPSFLVGGKVDILLIKEMKIDLILPTSQFHMSGYSNVYRLDRND